MGLALHKSPAHVGLSYLSFLDHSYLHHPKGLVMGLGQAPEAPLLMIILFLPLSPFLHQLMPSFTLLSSSELTLLLFLYGGLFIPFLFLDPVKCGSSCLLFFLVGCNLNSHIAHQQFIRGSNCPPGWPGGCFRVSDWRALAVQMHGDGWRKTSLGMGICMSSPLFWPPYWWQGGQTVPCQHWLLQASQLILDLFCHLS